LTRDIIIIIRPRYSELFPNFVGPFKHQCAGLRNWDAMSAVRCNKFFKYHLPQLQASNGSTETVTTSSYSGVVTSTVITCT
jgi:hypothetical protein